MANNYNTYSIVEILGFTTYLDKDIVNIFNKVSLKDFTTNTNFYDEYKLTNSERWDLISTRFYGTPKLWWLLAIFNNVKDPFAYLKENDKIKIIKPQLLSSIILKLKGYIK